MGYIEQRTEADKHNVEIMQILNEIIIPLFQNSTYIQRNPHIIQSFLQRMDLRFDTTISSVERDMKLCSDLDLTLKIQNNLLAVGCRIRKNKYQ